MNNDPIYNRLRELRWRRKLNAAEEAELQAWLEAHPESRADWAGEAGLDAALDSLPDVPVPSNFTARVLQAVGRETAPRPSRFAGWLRLRWLPRAAVAASVVAAGLVSYLVLQNTERKKLAESVAAVAEVSSLPSPDILQDYDAIRASNPTTTPDEQLLALLK